MKKTTLCYLIRDGEVPLAMKKRGFGEGGKRIEGECYFTEDDEGIEKFELREI